MVVVVASSGPELSRHTTWHFLSSGIFLFRCCCCDCVYFAFLPSILFLLAQRPAPRFRPIKSRREAPLTKRRQPMDGGLGGASRDQSPQQYGRERA